MVLVPDDRYLTTNDYAKEESSNLFLLEDQLDRDAYSILYYSLHIVTRPILAKLHDIA